MGDRKKPRPPAAADRQAAADRPCPAGRRRRAGSGGHSRRLVQRVPRGHLGRGAEPRRPADPPHPGRARPHARWARSPRPSAATRTTTPSCGWSAARSGTNSVDHCTRLCHSTSVSAMNRALNTAAASGSMREIEEACDVIFIAGANTTESHPVFGALIKRAVARGAKLIVADVRKVELAELADIHLQMTAGHRRGAVQQHAAPHHRGRAHRPRIHQRAHPRVRGGEGGGARPTRWRWAQKITGIPGGSHPPGRRDVRPRPPHLDALGHGPDPARHRHRYRRQPAQSAARLRDDRQVGRADDADPGTEQRAGRQRRGRHSLCLHRLSAGHRSGQPGRVRPRPGACPRNRSRSRTA